jgi:hypothetical protein
MSKIPVSTVVNVQIGLQSGAATRTGFGIPLIVDTQNVQGAGAGVPVLLTCATLQDLIDAGYETFDKAYVLATALLAQTPRVATFKVASVNALSSAELTAVEAADSNWYAFLVTSRTSADIQACATWAQSVATRRHLFFAETQDAAAFTTAPSVLSILQSAGRSRTAIAARVATPQTQELTISAAFVALNSVTLKVNDVALAPTVFAADSDATLAALAVALAATTEIATAVVTTVAGGTDNDRTIVITAADPLVPVQLSEYACTLGASQNTASFTITDAGAIPADASAAGLLIPKGLGEATLAGKSAPNLTPDDLSLTQFNLVTSKGGNVYVSIGDVEMFQKGQVMGSTAQGAILFLDTIAGVDRLEQALQDAVINQLSATDKIPYNNTGIAAVAAIVDSVGRDFVAKGILEPYQFRNAISYPDISAISPADKSARNLPDINAAWTGTGAIQSVSINATIAV